MMTKLIVSILLLLLASVGHAGNTTAIRGGNGIVMPPPPPTKAEPVTETIQGVTVTDPYRWLEDSRSPATREWLKAQMQYTEDYLSQVKIRPEVVKRLTELVRVDSYSIPIERGSKYFFKKRLAEENQGSI
jgi:prolyl oligopeptidase